MRKLAVVLVSVVPAMWVGLVLSAAPAAAGCCLVVTLDPVERPEPGEEVTLGFTVRINQQPTDELAGPDDRLGLTITPLAFSDPGQGGRTSDYVGEFFPARRDDAGHYVVEDVRFPEAGTYNWAVSGEGGVIHNLGTVAVGDVPVYKDLAPAGTSPGPSTTSPVVPAPSYRWALLWRVLLPALTLAAAVLVAVDLVVNRRRHAAPTAPIGA